MLKELLVKRKSSIVDKWVGMILNSYPSESLNFLKSQKDQFANPVGYTISSNAGKLFDEMIGDADRIRIKELLDDIIRIRAVQEFRPSRAVEFVFSLKEAIRNEIKEETGDTCLDEELVRFESKIDMMALIAFDLYMQSREKIFQIRVNEVKARSLQSMVQNGGPENPERLEHDGY